MDDEEGDAKLNELKLTYEKFCEIFDFNESNKIKKISYGDVIWGTHK